MKEINLGQVLIENRRQRQITQEELANHIGVSTAAVSKWETGSTYPDILMLPKLASYFDISIDELMGYEPQLNQAEIQKWYRHFSEEFASLPFDEAMQHSREMVKQYYSCYPFLLQIASLWVNYSMLAGSREKSEKVIEEALELFRRVKKGIDNPVRGKIALQMEACCLLALNRPQDVLRLLENEPSIACTSEPLLACAHQMTGNIPDAKRVLQIGIYQQTVSLMNLLSSYMSLCKDDPASFEETCLRSKSVADVFRLKELHPGILFSCYLSMAEGWAAFGETEKALEVLEQYAALASSHIYPMHLHGDSYFNLLDDWFSSTLDFGIYPPRSDSVIRQSIIQALTDNPAFASLAGHPRFRKIMEQIKYRKE